MAGERMAAALTPGSAGTARVEARPRNQLCKLTTVSSLSLVSDVPKLSSIGVRVSVRISVRQR